MEKFNHHMLTLARDSRALTQAELASKMGIMQGTLSRYETGFQEPPPEVVSALSDALGYNKDFFYEVGRPTVSHLSIIGAVKSFPQSHSLE